MKTKVIVVTLLSLVSVLRVGTHMQAQVPPEKAPQEAQTAATQTAEPNTTGLENAAQNTNPNQTIVSNPMKDAIQKEIQNANAAPNKPTQASGAQLPVEFSSGIAAMLNAKSALASAGNRWGGHEAPAMRLLERALTACGQTQTANSAATQPPPANEQTAMQTGITQLKNAKSVFEKAPRNGSGCPATAISLINQALQELQAGIDFANSHSR